MIFSTQSAIASTVTMIVQTCAAISKKPGSLPIAVALVIQRGRWSQQQHGRVGQTPTCRVLCRRSCAEFVGQPLSGGPNRRATPRSKSSQLTVCLERCRCKRPIWPSQTNEAPACDRGSTTLPRFPPRKPLADVTQKQSPPSAER